MPSRGAEVPQELAYQLSGEITAFKSLPTDVRAHIMRECPWRSKEWGAHSRPVAPPARAPRIRSSKWVAPAGPTEEELRAARRAEHRRQKLIQSGRLKQLMAVIMGKTAGAAFMEWRRNAKRRRTYRFGRGRMRWIYARLFEHGRLLSRAFLGWWSHSHYQIKSRNLIVCGLNRWMQPATSKALNRWKQWLDIKFKGRDLIRRVAMRIKNQAVARCYASWVQILVDKREEEEKIKKILAMMMGNTRQYYFSTWRDNVRFLRDREGQMGDKEVRTTFYEVGKVTVCKRIVVPTSHADNQPDILVQLGDVEVWLPRSALTVCGSRPSTRQLEVGAAVRLVDSKQDLKSAFQALGSSSTVEMTEAKAAWCGCIGRVIAPNSGDGTVKVDFSGRGGDHPDTHLTGVADEVPASGWYPASALELHGTRVNTSSSEPSEAVAVGAQVRVKRGARAMLPVNAQAAAAGSRYTGEVLEAPDPAPGLTIDVPSSRGGSAYSGYSDSAGGVGAIGDVLQLGTELGPGGADGWPRRRRSGSREGSRRSSQHAQDASSLLSGVGAAQQRRRRASGSKQRRGSKGDPQPAELFDLHLDRPLSRVADNLGMHYVRRAAHVLNVPPRGGRVAPTQIAGLRVKSQFGDDNSGGASSGEMLRS